MSFLGFCCHFVGFHRCPWASLDYEGISFVFIDYNWPPWNIMEYHRFSQILMDHHGFSEIVMDYGRFVRFSYNLEGPPHFKSQPIEILDPPTRQTKMKLCFLFAFLQGSGQKPPETDDTANDVSGVM